MQIPRILLLLPFLLTSVLATDDVRLGESFNYYKKSSVAIHVDDIITDGLTGTENGWMGTGFFIDPEKAIIATNYHVFSGNVIGQPQVTMYDGYVYKGDNIEVLYSNPTGQQFDFALLRIKNLQPQHRDLPKPIFQADPTKIKKGGKVGSIGCAEGIPDTFLDGTLTDVYGVDDEFEFDYITYPNYALSLICIGGASGSPVYNAEKEIIGILNAGSELHTFIVPIRYVLNALESIKSGTPLTIYTLGMNMKNEKISHLEEYYGFVDSELKTTVSKTPEYTQRVIQVHGINPLFKKENPEIQIGDVIKKVDGVVVGPDYSKVHDLVMADGQRGRSVHLTLDRYGQTVELDVKPMAVPYEVVKATQFSESLFIEANSTISYHYGIPRGVPVIFEAPINETYAMRIRKVDGKLVANFDEMVKTFHALQTAGRKKFTLNFDMGTPGSEGMLQVNTKMKRNPRWFVTQKGEDGDWEDVKYKNYVKTLEAPVEPAVKKQAVEMPVTKAVVPVTTKSGARTKVAGAASEPQKGRKRGRATVEG